VIIAALGWRLRRGRRAIASLAVGAVQFILGIVIFINRYNIH
jgi:hypothetical protein